jgi:hypothetical protein
MYTPPETWGGKDSETEATRSRARKEVTHMVRRIAVLLAGLLLLIPTSAFARNDDKEAPGPGVMLTAGDVDASVYISIDLPARETGRELHE